MDTSDSECFESADEEIQSDEDTITIAKAIIKNDNDIDKKVEETATSLDIVEDVKCEDKNLEKHEGDNDIQTPKNDELQISSESHLVSELQNMKIENESSASQQLETPGAAVVHETSEIISHEPDEYLEENISKEVKKSKIKAKLGSKTTKKLTQFEASPEKKVIKSTEKIETNSEVKNLIRDPQEIEEKKVVEEENLWDNDELDWGVEAEIENKSTCQSSSSVRISNKMVEEEKGIHESDGWSSWGNWGASVLSTATQSVSTITSQITNVIESGLGAVDPEELARIEREEKKKLNSNLIVENREQQAENCPSDTYGGFGFGNIVKLVENTGTKVINGGLDTLETIGKKTMEVLQEGDPGLKKKKAFLKLDQDKPVLSQILREAKERAENESRTSAQTSSKKWKNYETLFDDHHGLVHLEALELLSKQCEIKLKGMQSSMSGDEYTDFSETMDQIKELCELQEEDEEEQMSIDEIKERLEKAVTQINVPVSYEKLVTNWRETEVWLSTLNLEICDDKELHQQAIETLAEMTSRAMEQFHKTGELLLVKERRRTADEADNLVQITSTLISLIGIVAAKFSEKLNGKIANNKEISGLITNVFFEAANSSSYIQDALQLLIPVLQVGAI